LLNKIGIYKNAVAKPQPPPEKGEQGFLKFYKSYLTET